MHAPENTRNIVIMLIFAGTVLQHCISSSKFPTVMLIHNAEAKGRAIKCSAQGMNPLAETSTGAIWSPEQMILEDCLAIVWFGYTAQLPSLSNDVCT